MIALKHINSADHLVAAVLGGAALSSVISSAAAICSHKSNLAYMAEQRRWVQGIHQHTLGDRGLGISQRFSRGKPLCSQAAALLRFGAPCMGMIQGGGPPQTGLLRCR